MIRCLARRVGLGCVCCGRMRHLLWRKGDHSFARVTICVECKFGACAMCGSVL